MQDKLNLKIPITGNDWDILLAEQFQKEYYQNLAHFLTTEYDEKIIYPPCNDIFNALKLTPYSEVKVLILGQDPYHGEGQSHGLAFSIKDGVRIAPSLRNILKELKADTGQSLKSGDLTHWAKQGVLLLNTVLTVEQKSPNSHKNKGWEIFTDSIISLLNEKSSPIVFILWGANAKAKQKFISNPQHKVLLAPHPSPLSAFGGFFGCKHFSQCNEILAKAGAEIIRWGDEE